MPSAQIFRQRLTDNFLIESKLPDLSDPELPGELRRLVRQERLGVVMLDPLYLCMGAGGRRPGRTPRSSRPPAAAG